MTQSSQHEIGRLLSEAVPPLPEPEDRLRAVATRVRRARWRTATTVVAAAAALAAVAVMAPAMVGPLADRPAQLPAGPAGCPNWIEPTYEDAPGPLVPMGAVDITMCGNDGPPALLTTGVEQVVAALNDLARPGEATACQVPGFPLHRPSLVLRYPDGDSVVVYVDYRCMTVSAEGVPTMSGAVMVSGGPTRFGNPIYTFRELHRSQVVANTDPESIATPRCPPRVSIDPDSDPQDNIERYSIERDAYLPVPLVAATSCRYAPDGAGGGRLVDSYRERGDLARLRDAVTATVTGEHSSCASDVETMGTALPDVIRLADATGGLAEVWVYSTAAGAPCPAAFTDPLAMHPEPELVAYLDRVLGPPG